MKFTSPQIFMNQRKQRGILCHLPDFVEKVILWVKDRAAVFAAAVAADGSDDVQHASL